MSKIQNKLEPSWVVLVIRILIIRLCFEFRYSNFEFREPIYPRFRTQKRKTNDVKQLPTLIL
jgi:hypothetical protein